MSFFGWFKSAPQPRNGLIDAARDARAGDPKDAAKRAAEAEAAERRKDERAHQRALLYKVVRESMVRVGVLSSSFKFKVLATDPRGKKFIVMMDLSPDFGSEISQLAEIEKLIRQSARARHNIAVSAVYWRTEAAATGHQPDSTSDGEKYRATLPASATPPEPVAAVPESAHAAAQRPAFDPVLADEINALKQALAAGSAAPSVAGRSAPAAQTSKRLTGYEITEIIDSESPDTEIADSQEAADTELLDDDTPYPGLSATQYGELR